MSNILFNIAVVQKSSLKAEIWTQSTELSSTLNPKKATSILFPLYELWTFTPVLIYCHIFLSGQWGIKYWLIF